ncbi:MAG TPA: HNH endonuclease [Ramlibacter sp.]|nr:HNH endonuclease [Ramlibacter sp.]
MRIRIDGQLYYRYRLAWFYMTGIWPSHGIDHRNGDSSDDRWENLRDVTQSVNMQNLKRAPRHSSTGLLGAHRTRYGTFESTIQANKRKRRLGTFESPEEAHAAYLTAKRQDHPGNTL